MKRRLRGFYFSGIVGGDCHHRVVGRTGACRRSPVRVNRLASAACQNNLRQFGIGLHIFADRDRLERLCTGASDFRRDGCMDTWGWVADLVNINAALPNEMLVPVESLAGLGKAERLAGCRHDRRQRRCSAGSSGLPASAVPRSGRV